MVIGKIRPTATIVAQFAAGVEVEAIQHDGKMYLPVVGMGEFAVKDDAPIKPAVAPAAPAEHSPEKPKDASPAKGKSQSYTEDDLMEMDVKSLTKILKDEFGIDPNEYEGKNTNKKLRLLILDAQNGEGDGDNDDDGAEDKKPSKPSKDESEDANEDDLVDQVAEILEDFDSGKKNKKKTISSICALSDDADEDKITELVENFEDDADADLDETADKIAKALNGEAEEKPAKRSKKSDEELVDASELKVGDRVSVWWDDDNQEWYDGEVKSIKRGKVVIAYDDDTEEAIDPEVHTKIKRLAD